MIIREAIDPDIPEIIKVLKISLGETKLPKSEIIWRYKHLENPFGKSLVMVALIDKKIIGVRSFMKWNWRRKEEEFLALRAVDTAILPEFQRKGIFQKLNQAGIDLSKKKGINFIFNTPNSKSLGANLKMGWEKVGKLKVKLYIANPIDWLIKNNNKINLSAVEEISDLSELLLKYNSSLDKTYKVFTPKSKAYLKWRYEENPLQKYDILGDEDYFIAAYLKKHNNFNELRIAEHIGRNKQSIAKIKLAIKYLVKKYNAKLVSSSTSLNLSYINLEGSFGPILTSKGILMDNSDFTDLKNLKNWEYTLGDLELF